MIKRVITLCVVGMVAVVASPAAQAPAGQTESQPEFAHIERAAWDKMQESLLRYFSADGAARMKFMVYHAVAAELCGDDVRMDVAKAAEVVREIHPENWVQLSEQDKATWNTKFIGNYGMVYGIMLAEHTHDIGALCAEAKALASDAESGSLFVAPSAKAPAGK